MGWDQICGLTGWVGVVRCKSEAINIEVGWDTVEDERWELCGWVGGGVERTMRQSSALSPFL